MLLRAGLIELAEGGPGPREAVPRRRADRAGRTRARSTSGVDSDLRAAMLDEVQRGWAEHGSSGHVPFAQITARISARAGAGADPGARGAGARGGGADDVEPLVDHDRLHPPTNGRQGLGQERRAELGRDPAAPRRAPAARAPCRRPACPRGTRRARSNDSSTRLDGLGVADHVLRGEERQRVADVGREVVADAGSRRRASAPARRRRGRAARARRHSGRSATPLFAAPASSAQRAASSAPAQSPARTQRLDRSDRPAPAAGRRVGEALAVAVGGAVEPLAASSGPALHQQREPRASPPRCRAASAGAAARRRRPRRASRASPSRVAAARARRRTAQSSSPVASGSGTPNLLPATIVSSGRDAQDG